MFKLSSVLHKETKPHTKIVDILYLEMSAEYRWIVAVKSDDSDQRRSEGIQSNKRDTVISFSPREYSSAIGEAVNYINFSKWRCTASEKAE